MLKQVAKSPDGNGGVYTGTVIPHFKHFSLNAMEYCGFRDLDRCYLLVVYHIEVSQLTFELFPALKSSRLLEEMNTRGIKYVDCYGVDNALVICPFPPIFNIVFPLNEISSNFFC